jgi:hypothetical protein
MVSAWSHPGMSPPQQLTQQRRSADCPSSALSRVPYPYALVGTVVYAKKGRRSTSRHGLFFGLADAATQQRRLAAMRWWSCPSSTGHMRIGSLYPRRCPDALYAPTVPTGVSGRGGAPCPKQRSIPALAADLGVSSEALRHWLRQAGADAGRGQPGDLTTDERDELRRLRRENHVAAAGSRPRLNADDGDFRRNALQGATSRSDTR